MFTPTINTQDMQFTANQLAHNKNLLPIESSADGINYCWSGASPQLDFTFSLDRRRSFSMQVRVFALIKPEYLKQLKLFIDGMHIKHRFSVDRRLFVLSCNLPHLNKKVRLKSRSYCLLRTSPANWAPVGMIGNLALLLMKSVLDYLKVQFHSF